MWRTTAVYLILMLLTPAVFAHGALHDQISSLSDQIRNQPSNDELFMKRGRAYLEDGRDADARNDFRQALRLNQNARSAYYFLGQLALKHERYGEAQQYATRFLDSLSGEPGGLSRGYRLLGDVHTGKKEFKQAAQAYQAAIDHAQEPRPDFFLDLANAYLKLGDKYYDHAIDTLEKGIERLGALTVLQDKAVQVNVDAGRLDAALTRLDAMIAHGQRLPELYERKGYILRTAGRSEAAKHAFQLALEQLDHLPPARRNTEVMKELRQNLVAVLE